MATLLGFQQLATRMLASFGAPGTLSEVSEGTYNVSTGASTPAVGSTSVQLSPVLDFREVFPDREITEQAEGVIFLSGENLLVTPRAGMRVAHTHDGSRRWRVIAVERFAIQTGVAAYALIVAGA